MPGSMPLGHDHHWVQQFGLLGIWVFMIGAFGLLRPDSFLSMATFSGIISSQAVLLILGLGLLPSLTSATLDLSAPFTLGLAITLVGQLNVVMQWPIWITIPTVILCCALVGAVNAFFVVGLNVDSIVVTLGTGTVLSGAALGINLVPTTGISPALVNLARYQVLGLQLVFFFGLALTLATWYFFTYTITGRHLFFVGAGPDVARLTGINVNRFRAGSLIYGAAVAGIAGILLAGTLGSSSPTIGGTYLLPVFASIFLGATTIKPGRFNAWGTLIAVYFLTTGVTGLELLGVSGWINHVFYGAALVLAAALTPMATRQFHRGRASPS